MNRNCKTLIFTALCFIPLHWLSADEMTDAKKLFKQTCSLCHAIDKKKFGPAVNAMSREREFLRETIAKGKKPMPAYEGKLTAAQIDALVEYLLANQ